MRKVQAKNTKFSLVDEDILTIFEKEVTPMEQEEKFLAQVNISGRKFMLLLENES